VRNLRSTRRAKSPNLARLWSSWYRWVSVANLS